MIELFHRAVNTEKLEAAKLVYNRAIANGRLVRGPCAICGKPNGVGHHENYDKPLDVVWLCPSHHRLRHNELNRLRMAAAACDTPQP